MSDIKIRPYTLWERKPKGKEEVRYVLVTHTLSYFDNKTGTLYNLVEVQTMLEDGRTLTMSEEHLLENFRESDSFGDAVKMATDTQIEEEYYLRGLNGNSVFSDYVSGHMEDGKVKIYSVSANRDSADMGEESVYERRWVRIFTGKIDSLDWRE